MRDIVIGKDPWNPRQRYALERVGGRPSQGGGHAVLAWRPTCRAGRCEPLLASREPPSKARGEARGERPNTAERPSGNTAREPARAEPNVNTQSKHLTNTAQESMMPSSAQPPILWADQGTCPIPAEPTQPQSGKLPPPRRNPDRSASSSDENKSSVRRGDSGTDTPLTRGLRAYLTRYSPAGTRYRNRRTSDFA